MRNIITIELLKSTATYRELESKKEQVKINILETRASRERITHAFYVWKNQGIIPTTVKYYELAVVNDLICAHKGTDRIFDMECKAEIVYKGDTDND